MLGVRTRFAPKAPMSPKPKSSHSTTTKFGRRIAAAARAHGPTDARARAAALRCRNDRRCILAPPVRNALRIVGERSGQDLERDVTTEHGVFGAIDFAHPTLADEREHLVAAEASTGS